MNGATTGSPKVVNLVALKRSLSELKALIALEKMVTAIAAIRRRFAWNAGIGK